MLQLEEAFDLSCHQKELVISALLIGALIAALVAGMFTLCSEYTTSCRLYVDL